MDLWIKTNKKKTYVTAVVVFFYHSFMKPFAFPRTKCMVAGYRNGGGVAAVAIVTASPIAEFRSSGLKIVTSFTGRGFVVRWMLQFGIRIGRTAVWIGSGILRGCVCCIRRRIMIVDALAAVAKWGYTVRWAI